MMGTFLNPNFIMVADHAYFQVKRLDSFVEHHQPFVIRMKMNVSLHRKKSLRSLSPPDSNITKDVTCQLDTPQARWGIEVFFRWIKQHLNVPTLFGTTENAVFNQLYAALIAYLVLKVLNEERKTARFVSSVSFVGFTRQLIEGCLCVEWELVFSSS